MNNHSTELALAFLNASPVPRIVGEPRLWIADALDACPSGIVARRLGCSPELVRGWRTGKSLPNLDHLARAPRAFTRSLIASLDAHVRGLDQLAAVDPDQALRLLYLAFGALLADLSRKPLIERSPEEAREIEEKADEIAEQANRVARAARQQRFVVEAPREDKGAR